VDAGEQLDQRRLAGPVLADDGVDLAGLEGEVDRLERVGRPEALVEPAQGRSGGAAGRSRPASAASGGRPPGGG
jgi:hypothetical protein